MRRRDKRKRAIKRTLFFLIFIAAIGGFISLGFKEIPATTTIVKKDIPGERLVPQQ